MDRPKYTETLTVKVPPDWRERISRTAFDRDMSPSEWLRHRIRTGLAPRPWHPAPTLFGAEAERFERQRQQAKEKVRRLIAETDPAL